MTKVFKCLVCNTAILPARVEFLLESGVLERDLTCVTHSLTAKIKGIYNGEHGTSDIILCDKVYDDSVRSKFSSVEEEDNDDVISIE